MIYTKQKYYYAIVDAENDELILQDGKLPVYWMLGLAKKNQWVGTVVKRISGDSLRKILERATVAAKEKQPT